MNDLQRTIFGQSEVVGSRHERMAGDYYPTPEGVTRSLLNRVAITGTVFECCAGHGAIADVLQSRHRTDIAVFQSDLNWPSPNGEIRDATERQFWQYWLELGCFIDWTVTNPPFREAERILPLAWEYSERGCAFLLRLSYLEPTAGRGKWLAETADQLRYLIPLNPRPKFRRDTQKADSVTVAWFVWEKGWSWQAKGIRCPFSFVSGW